MSSDEPNCERCGSATVWFGMVSAPPHQIYRCDSCGHFTWVAGKPKTLARELPAAPNQQKTPEQPQAQQQQQQQQPQPKKKDDDQ